MVDARVAGGGRLSAPLLPRRNVYIYILAARKRVLLYVVFPRGFGRRGGEERREG